MTQALVLHNLRNMHTKDVHAICLWQICLRFLFLLFVINPTEPNGIDFTEGGKLLIAR